MSETNIGKAPTPTYCSNCGVEAKATAKFCFACGEAIYRGPSIEALPRNQAEPAPPLPAEEAGTTQPLVHSTAEIVISVAIVVGFGLLAFLLMSLAPSSVF